MTNLMDAFEKKQIQRLTSKKRIPAFRSGDTLKVTIKITEGDKSRSQVFEGMCIARKNNSTNSNFTVRKVSHGEGVERVFPLFSPIIEKIEVVRKGDVRRAKLYYLRSRTGKNARIADKDRGDELDQFDFVEEIKDEEKPDDKVELSTPEEQNKEVSNSIKEETQTKENNLQEKQSVANDGAEKTPEPAVNDAEKKADESKP